MKYTVNDMAAISLRLPDDIEARLNEEPGSSNTRVPKPRAPPSIVEYLERRERERFMAELVREARIAFGDPNRKREALEIAEEGVELSNEALDAAEGRALGEPWPEVRGEQWWR